MSLLGIARPGGRHRVPSVRELQRHIAELQLSRRILKATAHRLAVENSRLERQLDAAGIALSGLSLDLEEEQQETARLRAALANATSVSAPATTRDITPDEQPMHPAGINVKPLWDALGIVPGNPDPAHVPGL